MLQLLRVVMSSMLAKVAGLLFLLLLLCIPLGEIDSINRARGDGGRGKHRGEQASVHRQVPRQKLASLPMRTRTRLC